MDKLLKILKEICPGVDFENETALVDDELIDSFDLVTIASEIMNEFGVEFDVDDLVPENFNSAESMMELIDRYRA